MSDSSHCSTAPLFSACSCFWGSCKRPLDPCLCCCSC